MKLVLEIDLENAAFEEDNNLETARILSGLVEYLKRWGKLELGTVVQSLHDMNGNFVGNVEIVEEVEDLQEWVNKKRFDELQWAYDELVNHHAKHHKEANIDT
jgi:hypothetical protein